MNKYLYHALPFLKDIDEERRKQFEEYFYSAPVWVMDAFQVVELPKDTVFVNEGEPVNTIYFIGQGTIKATDYRIYGIAYDFMRFDGVYAMGGMEVVMDLDTYVATLQTVTPCTVVKIPRDKFEKWLSMDSRALKLEAKSMGHYLLEQSRTTRAFLFLQGADRLALYLTENYEKYAKDGVLFVDSNRRELSEATGLCVKTVNRSVKKFEGTGLITKDGNKFLIDREQYIKMNEMVSKIIER